MKGTVALAATLAALAAPATAAIYRIDFSFPTIGIPNPAIGSVTIDNDFDADFYVSEQGVISTSIGLTVNELNFAVDSDSGAGVFFMYFAAQNLLYIGGLPSGGAGGIGINTNDFQVRIEGFLTGTPTAFGSLVQGAGFIAVDVPVDLNIADVTDVPTVIPLPSTLPLALLGLGLLGLTRRRPV